MDEKFHIYEYDACPYCGGDLVEAGESKSGNGILSCINCGQIILEKQIDSIRRILGKDKDEDYKTRQ